MKALFLIILGLSLAIVIMWAIATYKFEREDRENDN